MSSSETGRFWQAFCKLEVIFFLGEHLAPAVSLHDHQGVVFDLFVGREAVFARQTFTATTNSRPLFGGSGIDDLVMLTAAFGTTHIGR